jgi:hypothetical protein
LQVAVEQLTTAHDRYEIGAVRHHQLAEQRGRRR